MSKILEDFKKWSENQDYFVFSGCVEEKYPAIKEGILLIGKYLNHHMWTYADQSCCSGPLTKMGLGNSCTLGEFTKSNLNLRKHNEKILLTSCNGCYSYMIKAGHLITDIEQFLINLNNNPKNNNPFLLHSIEYLALWSDQLINHIKYPLNGLSFVVQYGCHYLNQYRLSMERSFRNLYVEYNKIIGWEYNSIPTYMHDILIPLGAQIKNYNEELLCCGGSTPQRQINLDNSLNVAQKKFDSIHSAKPDAIVTNCPLCMFFMEDCQVTPQLEQRFKTTIPVIHINELMGLLIVNEEIKEKIISEMQFLQAQTTLHSQENVIWSNIEEQIKYFQGFINTAKSRAEIRDSWPNSLNKFPFILLKAFGIIFFKIFNFLFKDQREVNFNILSALEESVKLNQIILEQIKSITSTSQEELNTVKFISSDFQNKYKDLEKKINNLDIR
jgi:O-antigen chain-terminating methyltransferase